MASKAELKEAVERWQKHCETVQQATVVNTAETARERLARIKRVRADYAAFVEYYSRTTLSIPKRESKRPARRSTSRQRTRC